MRLWIKNTSGKPDAVLTLTLIGFVIVMLKVLLNGASLSFNGAAYSLGTIDAAMIAAVLSPTLGAYVARRYTDKRHPSGEVVAEAMREIEAEEPRGE